MLDTVTELEIDPISPRLMLVLQSLSSDRKLSRNSLLINHMLTRFIGLLGQGSFCRMCRLWISKHGLSKKNVQKLRLIIEFIIGVYFPNWFNIKVKHSWVDGPQHLFYQLQCIRSQKKKVVEIVMETVQ